MKKRSIIQICMLLLWTGTLWGCATGRNTDRTPDRRWELVPHPAISFRQVHAAETDGRFTVSGKLRRRGGVGTGVPSLVVVSLLAEDGTILATKQTTYAPRILGRRGIRREAHFHAAFDVPLPRGGTVRVAAGKP